MKANELIKELQKLVKENGDLELRLMIIDHEDRFHYSPVYTTEVGKDYSDGNEIIINGVPLEDRVD